MLEFDLYVIVLLVLQKFHSNKVLVYLSPFISAQEKFKFEGCTIPKDETNVLNSIMQGQSKCI